MLGLEVSLARMLGPFAPGRGNQCGPVCFVLGWELAVRAGALGILQPVRSVQEFSCEAQRDYLNNLIPGCDQAWRKGKGNKEAPSPEQQ